MGSSAPRAAGEPEDSFLGTNQTNNTFKMPKKANIFESFSQSAIQQFKEAFGIMDTDKDGLLSSSDLVAAFAAHGKNIGGGEAQAMLDEVDGPVNFTQMVTLFASRWLVAQMTMMLSLHPLKLLRWTAKLMPKHSDTHS